MSNLIPNLIKDLRYALRQMRKSPGFALTAILTLAVGIGATTAIFSFVDGVLLQPLAYQDSGKLVVVWEHVRYLEKLFPQVGPNTRHATFWRQAHTGFLGMSLVNEQPIGITRGQGDHPLFVGRVVAEPNLFGLLGVRPMLGRDFTQDEGGDGRDDRAIISFSLWQRLFSGSPDVLGQTLRIGDKPTQVIGVLPRDFYFPAADEIVPFAAGQRAPAIDLFVPTKIKTNDLSWNGDYGNYIVLGRLKPGIPVATAQSQLDAVEANIIRQAPAGAFEGDPKGALTTVVLPLKQAITGKASTGLYLLLASVVSLLLIACINLANAQLARVMARDREAALRSALGASAWNLIQTSLVESLLLATAGGALGVAAAQFALHRFANYIHVAIPRAANITLNPAVLAAAIVCTTLATVVFGALPALRYLRIRPQGALGSAGRAAGSSGGTTLRRWLIGAQVLACTALLLLTTLFAQNLLHLLRSDKGFQTGGTVMASLRLQSETPTEASRASFDDALLDRLRSLPSVTGAAMVTSILNEGQIWLDGVQRTDAPSGAEAQAQYRWISPDYFSTMRLSVLAGRPIDARDRSLKSAVISTSTAAAVWPNQDPIGRTFKRNDTVYTVVGIAADARSNSPKEAPTSMVYLPYWDNPPWRPYFLVHGTGDPALLAPAVRKAIWSYNPSVTIANVRPLDAEVADALAPERLQTTLLAGFGVSALFLALLGIYSTLNFTIGRRTQEFGIRLALGASRTNVYWITFREVAMPISLGLLGGWAASLVATRVVRSLLEGTPAISSGSVATVFAALGAATLLAAFFPCRRAAQLEPMDALRSE